MKDFLYDIWARFLTYFGQIKVLTFNFIPILAYDPEPFEVGGEDILHVMEVIRPGDVLIRGFNKYLDGRFIPDEKGYSHAGLYIGGKQVIHAAAPHVQLIHVIDFCEADRIMVLRPAADQQVAISIAKSKLGVPYDFDYKRDVDKLYCFELIANCYPNAHMVAHEIKRFFGLLRRKCYLAKSIYENNFFHKQFEKNEKKG